jgi:CRP-like cAMP-binding protein
MVMGDRRDLENARRLLASCALFRGFGVDERDAIVSRAHIRSFQPGDTIFRIGSPGDNMMAVLSGVVRIGVSSSDGKELLLAVLPQGQVFGELAVLDGKPRSADAIADGPCTLAYLERRDVLAFLERNPSAWPKLVEVVAERLRRTDELVAEIALEQLPVRLARTMLRVTSCEPGKPAPNPNIHYSQRELASMVGGRRESVNKCLRTWQRDGLVEVTGRSIVIKNRAALEEIAEVALTTMTRIALR